MEEKVLIAAVISLFPVAWGGIGMVVVMRIQIAVLQEKVEYQANQLRDLTKVFRE